MSGCFFWNTVYIVRSHQGMTAGTERSSVLCGRREEKAHSEHVAVEHSKPMTDHREWRKSTMQHEGGASPCLRSWRHYCLYCYAYQAVTTPREPLRFTHNRCEDLRVQTEWRPCMTRATRPRSICVVRAPTVIVYRENALGRSWH